MSTLKKILALTLALAMVLSLNVFAAFNDQATINEDCVTAVEMMNTLGVIKGDNNGNFNPEKTITRAEAATMIFRLANKGADGADGYKGAKYFDDVPGHWAEGYINFCYSMNIIAGRTATSFVPEAPVTGYELAKMLLCVLKYDQTTEGYTGADWARNVQNDAFAAGLLENYGMALSVPAQRQWAAVMFYDALDCQMATYLLGQLFIQDNSDTLGEKNFGLDTATGILNSVGKVTVSGSNAGSGKSIIGTTSYDFTADMDLLGQDVKVVFNAKNDKVYGITATGKSVVGESMICDTKYTSADGYTVGSLTGAFNGVAFTNDDDFTLHTATVPTTIPNSTGMAKAIDQDDDGDIDLMLFTLSQYGEIDIASDGKVKLNGGSAVEGKTVNYVNTVADEDIVKVTANLKTGKYDVEALDANVAKLVRKNSSVTEVRMGSVSYKISAQEVGATAYFTDNPLGTEVEFYTDGKFIVKAATKENAPTTELPVMVLLTAKGKIASGPVYVGGERNDIYMMKVLGLDGKVTEYEYKDIADFDITNDTYKVGTVYELVANTGDNAGTYKLKVLDADFGNYKYQATGSTKLNVKTARLDGKVIVPTDLKMFMTYKDSKNADAYKVVTVGEIKAATTTGDNANLVNYNNWYYYTESATHVKTMAAGHVLTGAVIPETTTAKTYAVASAASYLEYDDVDSQTNAYIDVVYVDGTEATLVLAENVTTLTGNGSKTAGLYEVVISETSGIASLTKITSSTADVTAIDTTVIGIDNGALVDIAANCVVVLDDKVEDTFAFSTLEDVIKLYGDTDYGTLKAAIEETDDGEATLIVFEAPVPTPAPTAE